MNLNFSINRETLLKIFKVGFLISEKESPQSLDFVQKSSVFWELDLLNATVLKCKMLFATEQFTFVADDIIFTMEDIGEEEIEPIMFGINTHKFSRLLSNSTTDNVEFTLTDTELIVKTNGVYKFPLIDKDNIIFGFSESLPEGKALTNYSEFVKHFMLLKNFTKSDLINPADRGIYINDAMMTAHTNTYGCVFDFANQVGLPLSFDLNFFQPLAKLDDLKQVELITTENHITIKGLLDEMPCYLEGRALDGNFNSYFIELITQILIDVETGNLTTLNITKDLWQNPFSRIVPFITDTISINYSEGQVRLSSPDGKAIEDVNFLVSNLVQDFNIIIHHEDLQRFFSVSDNLFLTFSPKYEKKYHIICVEAVKLIDGVDQTIAVGFICRFDE